MQRLRAGFEHVRVRRYANKNAAYDFRLMIRTSIADYLLKPRSGRSGEFVWIYVEIAVRVKVTVSSIAGSCVIICCCDWHEN
jgi:hypothetical protein